MAVSAWSEGRVLGFRAVDWTADLAVLRSGMEYVEYKRPRRGPWQTKPIVDVVRRELQHMHQNLHTKFSQLFSNIGPPEQTHFTWRPTITRGEMHVDKGTPDRGGAEELIITAFVNVDTEPRVWQFGEEQIEWPSGALWIFRAEKVPHRVVYGRCCVQYNWVLM